MELLPMRVTRPGNSCPGKASTLTAALSPTVRPGTSVSSTSTLASITDRSAMVSSRLPGLFIVPTTAVSPCSMFSRVTRPLIGATMVVLESWSRVSETAACAWLTAKRAASCSCSATCAWVRAFSTSAALTSSLVCICCSARRRSACALVSCARAWAARAWLCCTLAWARRTAAVYWVGSMRSSRSPAFTHCPSSTATCTTRPLMSAEMSTLRLGSIFPLAVTTSTSVRRPMASVATSTPSPPPLPLSAAMAVMAISTPATMATFFRLDMVRSSCPGGPSSAQRAAGQRLQRGQRLVVHVHGVDHGALRLGQARLRVHHLQRVGRAQAKALAGHPQLLGGVLGHLALQLRGAEGGLHVQQRRAHVAVQPLLLRADGQLGVAGLHPRLLDATLALQPVEQ